MQKKKNNKIVAGKEEIGGRANKMVRKEKEK